MSGDKAAKFGLLEYQRQECYSSTLRVSCLRLEFLLDPNLSSPISSVRPNAWTLGAGQGSVQSAYASAVPDMRQTLEGILPAVALDRGKRSEPHRAEVTIYHPSLGPSSVSTENALMARALLSPSYMHDSAATRMARVSTMPNIPIPRFGRTIDILA